MITTVLDEDQASMLYYNNQQQLGQFVVYNPTTSDLPDKWVVRFWVLRPDPVATEFALLADTLEEIRNLIPPGLVCFTRSPEDDPAMHETWM